MTILLYPLAFIVLFVLVEILRPGPKPHQVEKGRTIRVNLFRKVTGTRDTSSPEKPKALCIMCEYPLDQHGCTNPTCPNNPDDEWLS
ncbi:MAG: hypothetical protein DRI46_12075 [Chloroflexi bacterium]|nr:MAG: hypothetical protein DRI46_12075 [Chloroflexota bacterium]